MIRILRFIFTGDGHIHKWEILDSGHRYDIRGKSIGNFYDCRCSICGKIKGFET